MGRKAVNEIRSEGGERKGGGGMEEDGDGMGRTAVNEIGSEWCEGKAVGGMAEVVEFSGVGRSRRDKKEDGFGGESGSDGGTRNGGVLEGWEVEV